MYMEKSDHSVVATKFSKEDGAKGVTEMQRTERQQLNFEFADIPGVGRGQGQASGVPDAKSWLRHIAKSKELNRSVAKADSSTTDLLERVASTPVLAEALLHVARNKGAAGVDGTSSETTPSTPVSTPASARHPWKDRCELRLFPTWNMVEEPHPGHAQGISECLV